VAAQLEALGMPRGPKFDNVVEQVFGVTTHGPRENAGRAGKDLAQDHRNQEQPKKKEKEKKPSKGTDKAQRRGGHGDAAKHKHAAAKADANMRRKEAGRPQSRSRRTTLPRTAERPRQPPRKRQSS